ncbi:MAG: bifunctional diaminohydroxyphosphoribosylaminopyrimidine deaminase/5-amino-6-(5-phosphoribosylamino)uracil reductase RibD [Sandaracinaceae bacterium]
MTDAPDGLRVAFSEAKRGRPSPRPRLGVVIQAGDATLSAQHQLDGEQEPLEAALAEAGDRARGATLFCTLEPALEDAGVLVTAQLAKVVYAAARVSSEGASDALRAAGIDVAQHLEEEGEHLVRDWRHVQSTGLPFVTLKAAVTLDGRTASRTGDSKWITGEAARTEVHRMRDRTDAILVGVGTVLADDPALTVRHVEGRDPIRVVLDTHLRMPPRSQLARPGPPTWVFHGPAATAERRASLPNVELIETPTNGGHVDLDAVLSTLAQRGVVRLMVEGGATVHGAFLRERRAQRAAIFVAPVILGDADAIPLARVGPQPAMADAFRLASPHARTLGPDVLVEGDLL